MDDSTGALVVGRPVVAEVNGRAAVSATIRFDGQSRVLWYSVSDGRVDDRADPFLAATVYPAMRLQRPLRVLGEVSPRLLAATGPIQEIFHKWHPEFRQVPVWAAARQRDLKEGPRGVGCFFSGGVDSFYSLLKNRQEVTTLILVHGFDMALENHALRARVAKEVREVALELKKGLVEVETNLREVTDPLVGWNDSFGCALAGVALLLSERFGTVLIPSSNSYGFMEPHGSHPLLDPLFRTEEMELVHDGGEADRDEKVERIASHESVAKHLRVCWRNTDGAYNCGRCEKCLRTMLSLLAVGALDRCATFGSELRESDVAAMEITSGPLLRFAEENLRRLEAAAAAPGVRRGLELSIDRYRGRRLAGEFGENGPSFVRSREWTNVRDRIMEEIWASQRGWLCKSILKTALKSVDRSVTGGRLARLYARRSVR